MKTFAFQKKNYTEASLKAMSVEDLLTLRNLIASNLGVATVKSFTNHDSAVSATLAALQKFEDTVNAEANEAGKSGEAPKEPKAAKAPKEPKAPRERPKCYSAETVKRPSDRMFHRIKKIGMPDKSQRPFAWDSFQDGMRLIDIKEDPNLHAGKISFWMRQNPPLIELVPISADQLSVEVDAWYAKHGFVNPSAAKKNKAEDKRIKAEKTAELKAKKAAEAAEKKKAAEAAKAEAKAKKEADAKAKADKKVAEAAEKKAKAPAPEQA